MLCITNDSSSCVWRRFSSSEYITILELFLLRNLEFYFFLISVYYVQSLFEASA